MDGPRLRRAVVLTAGDAGTRTTFTTCEAQPFEGGSLFQVSCDDPAARRLATSARLSLDHG